MSADLFRLLFEYNRWANERILGEAADVAEGDYFAEAPGLSFGSLHGTLVHILIADLVWLARWQGGAPPAKLADARASNRIAADEIRSFESLMTLWREEEAKQQVFLSGLTDADTRGSLSYKNQAGEPNEQALDQLMLHVVNHGTQFRTEAAVRLTQLGRSPGDLDLIVFLRQRGAK